MYVDIYENGVSFITDEVSTVSISDINLDEENRIKFITDLAAVTRGKDESNNPTKRYSQLLKEAAPLNKNSNEKTPGRPFEFLPIITGLYIDDNKYIIFNLTNNKTLLTLSIDEFNNKIGKFSFIKNSSKNEYILYTNARALLNAGIEYKDLPYMNFELKDFYKNFKVFKIKVPMFVWAQLYTHQLFTKVSQSDRYVENEEYWMPKDFLVRLQENPNITNLVLEFNKDITPLINEVYNKDLKEKEEEIELDNVISKFLLDNYPQNKIKQLFKDMGYHREIYSRSLYYFKYKVMVFGGWNIDNYSWEHLLLERNGLSEFYNARGTQKETAKAAKKLREFFQW